MPCYDYRDHEGPSVSTDRLAELLMAEAVLCAMCSILDLEGQLFGMVEKKINWHEVGVDREVFLKWWEEHDKKDQARRLQEAAKLEKQKKIGEALAKLTDEERQLLGIK